jgi:hypothetical protein
VGTGVTSMFNLTIIDSKDNIIIFPYKKNRPTLKGAAKFFSGGKCVG